MIKKRLLIIFAIFILLPIVGAEIFIGQPDSLYNLGDELTILITITPSSSTSGFVIAELVCGSESREIYKNPLNIPSGKEKEIELNLVFDEFLVGEMKGDCTIRVSFGGEQAESQVFEISGLVILTIDIQGVVFDPGKNVRIAGKAIKDNGENLVGFVEIEISALNLVVAGPVKEGSFAVNFTIPENAIAGTHDIKVIAYEKDNSGNIRNQGESSSIIKIKQMIKSLDLALNEQAIIPGEEIVYSVVLLDQAGSNVEADVGITIYDPKGGVYTKKLVKSGQTNSVQTEQNYSAGYWKISSSAGTLTKDRIFFVEELQKADFEMVNGTLIIKNLGNVPYTKPVEIKIGDVVELKEVELGVGETKVLRLIAPDGDYLISVNDGESNEELGSVFLTGKAIGIKEGLGILSGVSGWTLWIIILIVLILAVLFFIYKTKMKRAGEFNSEGNGIRKIIVRPSLDKDEAKKINSGGVKIVESQRLSSTGVDRGDKQEASVVALKIKNANQLKGSKTGVNEAINKALIIARGEKAKIYLDGDYRVMIFSKALTREADNTQKAIRIAAKMQGHFDEYNKTHAQRISYGLGVHVGEMISDNKDGKISFTSIGNTVAISKRIADISDLNIILSGAIYRRVRGSVKAEKLDTGDFWKVSRIVDREQYSDFLHSFTDRQKRE